MEYKEMLHEKFLAVMPKMNISQVQKRVEDLFEILSLLECKIYFQKKYIPKFTLFYMDYRNDVKIPLKSVRIAWDFEENHSESGSNELVLLLDKEDGSIIHEENTEFDSISNEGLEIIGLYIDDFIMSFHAHLSELKCRELNTLSLGGEPRDHELEPCDHEGDCRCREWEG